MARSKSKKKNRRTIACKHLVQVNEISNAGSPLCYCEERDFNMSPFNVVCQVCELYDPNPQDITHDQMYQVEGAEVQINWEEIEIDEEEEEEEEIDEDADEFDDDLLIDKKQFLEEEDEDEFEEEEEEEEEIDGLIIGHERDEEDLIDYEDEREEALGKKGTGLGLEDEDELEEELEELEELEEELEFEDDLDIEEVKAAVPKTKSKPKAKAKAKTKSSSGSTIDFEKDVMPKIKTITKNGKERQVCPFCGKDYAAVLRHIYRCKRAPEGIEEAYNEYKETH